MDQNQQKPQYPDCFRCKHYRVTWDYQNARGCDFYQFKSPELPSKLVYKQSGIHCQAFQAKPQKK